MKITLQYSILLFFTLIYSKINAQDVITKRNGEDVYSKVLEITQTEIKYKKFENENGPTYTILIKDVLKIHYENGTNDIFN